MHRFRTFILIALACLLAFGVGSVAASAGHHAQNGDQKAKIASSAQSSERTATAHTAKRATYVYITNTGAKYHRNGCRYLAHSKIKKTLKWAKSHGYKPCKVCKPPK
jgi:hypothetical protein